MNWSFIPRSVLCSLLFSSGGVLSETEQCPPPKPFEATYYSEIDHFVTLRGEGVQKLQQVSEDRYKFHFNVESMVADIRESVVFSWDAEQCLLIPHQYRHSLEGRLIPDRATEYANYPEDNEFRGHYRGKAFTTDAKDRYVDPLGLQIQVRQDLKAGKTTLKYYMVHKGKVLIDRYRVVGHESLTLNEQRYDTVKLEKVRPDTSDRETYMWMAPDLDYALVRLVHQEPDKERYEVVLKSFN